jgi:hypothetical protein
MVVLSTTNEAAWGLKEQFTLELKFLANINSPLAHLE